MQKKSPCFTTRRIKNYENISYEKPHKDMKTFARTQIKSKKSSPFCNGKDQTGVYKSLMEPKQHIIK